MKKPHLHRLGFAVLMLAAVTTRGQQYDQGVDINITSTIDWPEKAKRDADHAYAKSPVRAQHFFLARVSEERSDGINLVRPVAAKVLADQVTRQLELRGFQRVQPGRNPDIVVTVKYGRAVMEKMTPYTNTDDDRLRGGMSTSNPITPWPTRERFVGAEERNQRLYRAEKPDERPPDMLFIQVRAWQYPPPADPKKMTKLLWMTTMIVDDPDHRDLNTLSEEMLEKGAFYFDRHINRDDDVIINTVSGFRGKGPPPDGHVNVGAVKVVKDPKSD